MTEVERLRIEVERLVQKIDREAYRKGLVLRRAKDAEAALAVERARLAKVERVIEPFRSRDPFDPIIDVIDEALASVPEPSDSEPERIVDCTCGHGLYRHGKHGIGGKCRIIRCGCLRYVPDRPAPDAVCWRSECQRGCAYPGVCSERPKLTPDADREAGGE